MRKGILLMAFFVMSFLSVALVSASTLDNTMLEVTEVEIDDQEVSELYTRAQLDVLDVNDLSGVSVDEGETIHVDVELTAWADLEDVEMEVEIRGYEYSDYEDLSDRTHMFDIDVPGDGSTTKRKSMSIDLPNKLDKDRYLLRLTVDNKDSAELVRYVVLQVEPARHGVDIADVTFSPGNSVKAGRSLLTTVLLRNYGDKHEKDVKVTVAIPALGVSASEFVDLVEMDEEDGLNNIDYEDVPEMFLPLPPTAEAGDYEVVVRAQYDDLRETVSETYTISVVANEMFQETSDKLVLAIGPESQTVATGRTAMYGVALTNAGRTSKAYTVDVVAGDWATTSVSDSLVVLEPGKNKVVYVDLAVSADAPLGEHMASVSIRSGSDVLETVALRANVVVGQSADDGVSLRNGLEIALIVLVVLLVIIGLIIGFSRLKKDDNEEEQTYY